MSVSAAAAHRPLPVVSKQLSPPAPPEPAAAKETEKTAKAGKNLPEQAKPAGHGPPIEKLFAKWDTNGDNLVNGEDTRGPRFSQGVMGELLRAQEAKLASPAPPPTDTPDATPPGDTPPVGEEPPVAPPETPPSTDTAETPPPTDTAETAPPPADAPVEAATVGSTPEELAAALLAGISPPIVEPDPTDLLDQKQV